MTQPDAPYPATAESGQNPVRGDLDPLRGVIRKIGWELDHSETWMIPPGDVAALRRTRPGEIGGPAFWKIAVRHLEPAGLLSEESAPWRDDQERRWSTILGGMADMAGFHGGGARLGRVLAQKEVSEHRLMRLLRAEGDVLLDRVRTIARLLASQGSRLDWTDLADLVRRDGSATQDRVRRRIALDYYSHLNR